MFNSVAVYFEFLHDYEYSVGRFEHLLEINHSRMMDFLQNVDFRPQQIFLVRGEFQFIDEFDCDVFPGNAVNASINCTKLAGT